MLIRDGSGRYTPNFIRAPEEMARGRGQADPGMLRRFLSRYRKIEDALGYGFRNARLLECAFTHRSYRFENKDVNEDNQRLEFLGDAVLGFVMAAHTYRTLAAGDEGVLSAVRSQLTSGKTLARIAREIGLGEYLRLGKGEEASGGRRRTSNLADLLEAVIGAAYLDGGVKAVEAIFARLFEPLVDSARQDVTAHNPKGTLQEICQRQWKANPQYELVTRTGPAHAAIFSVSVRAPDGSTATGSGPSKQDAEQRAAASVLQMLTAAGVEIEAAGDDRQEALNNEH